ncbi:unnamed protein product, partial [Schistosoma bovis]
MVTRIQPLPGKSYSLPSRGGGVVHEIERTKSEFPALQPGWWIWRVQLGALENPDSKQMAHKGSRVLREQMAYEPTVGHRLPWDCMSLRCSN